VTVTDRLAAGLWRERPEAVGAFRSTIRQRFATPV